MTQTTLPIPARPAVNLDGLELDNARAEDVLRRRTEELANRVEGTTQVQVRLTALTVRSGTEILALPVRELGAIFCLNHCAWVPGTDIALLGVSSDRGDLVGVYDLRRLFAPVSTEGTRPAHAVIIRHPRQRIAIAVERVEGIAEIAVDGLSAPDTATTPSADLIRGVAPNGVILLNVEALRQRIVPTGEIMP